MKFGMNVVFNKIFDPYLFFIGTGRWSKGWTILKVLSNILEIIEDNCDNPFLCILMKLVFFNDEFNGAHRFAKETSFV